MYLFLLKKALPFTLTFIFGAALSGLTGLFGASEKKSETVIGPRTYEFNSRCRMRRHRLVAETKPLAILDVPRAELSGTWAENVYAYPVTVDVTFGADGKVREVEPVGSWCAHGRHETTRAVWDAVERAARRIRFEPETIDGVPVTVTRKVEIHTLKCDMLNYAEH